MSSAKYKFETNLLQLSESTYFNTAKTEWITIPRETEKGNELCLCQHRIKNINYMFNTRTNRIITIGKDCLKKFNFGSQTITNSIYIDGLNKYINLGYGKIDDIHEFSKKIEELYLKSVIEKYEMYKFKYHELCNLEKEVKQLVDNNYVKLQALHHKIIKQILYLKSQYEARQTAKQEHMQIARLEEAKKQAEIAERTKLLIIKTQETSKNECRCGLLYSKICKCEVPNYDIANTTDYWCKYCGNIKNDSYYGCKCFGAQYTKPYYYFCTQCKKWQDRCI